jgi:hypothetical protein
MKTIIPILLGLVTWAVTPAWAQKTDLATERYVEMSETDFVLKVKVVPSTNRKVVVFEVSAAQEGAHTLLCFVDGKFWTRKSVTLPTKYSLNVGGLAAGSHRVTLQAVTAAGKVGSASQTLNTSGKK